MRPSVYSHSAYSSIVALSFSAILLFAGLGLLRAQTITSDPANGATGVSVSAPVTFTFSSAVDPTKTTALFLSMNPPGSYPVTSSWNTGNTVLTCTPNPPFPANATVSWTVLVNVTPIPVFAQGSFSTGTGTGGGGGGSGTNAITTFSVGKFYFYQQTNSSAPTTGTNFAYLFNANTSLASNIAATAVTMTIPGASSPTSLNQNFVLHEDYYFVDFNIANSTNFEMTYPEGDYPFKVMAATSNLQATVTLPTTMLQPNAPHVSNFDLAQKVDASQAFTVPWDAPSADFITLSINDSMGTNVYQTPGPGTNGALPGTALSAMIPAGKLAANSSYMAQLTFIRYQAASNVTYATVAYRASGTQFPLHTISTASGPPVVSNPVWSASGFGFDVTNSSNKALLVRFSTNCALAIAQWSTILTNNNPGNALHIVIPVQPGGTGFLRLQNAP
jgi:hypothetical protein